MQLKTALAVCRSDDSPDSYVAYRRLLIERPVLTRAELDDLLGEVELLPVADLLPDCYPEAPAAYRQDGRFAVCAGCGCLMRPQRNGGWTCELDRCRRHGEAAIGRLIDLATTRGVHHLALPLRTFITGPGLVEIELESELRKLGLQVDMWPDFDAYDLAVTFRNGTVWAIDAKDRADPRLLGRSMTWLPRKPDWNRFFLVVPDHRVAQRADYISTFKRHCDTEIADRLRLYSVREFLKLVRRHLRQSKEVPHA
ncbi:hypothetical protein ACFQ3B_00040 [Stackebrandtia endophytica]|uniref:restriction endonuclease-related protein n=1 Tax=Stackebrandtia endophytica TaxID=1496996 RepID=UPI00114EF32B|nr:hypothetical protein [Stackebrandtia endophytica]